MIFNCIISPKIENTINSFAKLLPAWNHFCDLGPLISMDLMSLYKNKVFINVPRVFADHRIQMVVPPIDVIDYWSI